MTDKETRERVEEGIASATPTVSLEEIAEVARLLFARFSWDDLEELLGAELTKKLMRVEQAERLFRGDVTWCTVTVPLT